MFGKTFNPAGCLFTRKINTPGWFLPHIFLSAICAELDRYAEARSALEELLRLYPGFNAEQLTEEARKWNYCAERIRHLVAALRKAGLPE